MKACLGVGGVGEELGRFGRGEQRIEVVYNHVCCFRGKKDRFLGGSEKNGGFLRRNDGVLPFASDELDELFLFFLGGVFLERE